MSLAGTSLFNLPKFRKAYDAKGTVARPGFFLVKYRDEYDLVPTIRMINTSDLPAMGGEVMDGSTNQKLLQLVTGPSVTGIADVITNMQAINSLLADNDGLKWFNLLYLLVTQEVDTHPPDGGWEDPAWLTRLDIVFAEFYFKAIADWLQHSPSVASSWKALLQARFTAGIDRIQFALAGMNAHINHDLALALLETDAELNLVPTFTSPEHDDFEHVNGLLEAVLPQALQFLATGIVGELAQDTGKIGRLLAIWNVRAARDMAWGFADSIRPLGPIARVAALAAQDQLTGVIGRSLLQLS